METTGTLNQEVKEFLESAFSAETPNDFADILLDSNQIHEEMGYSHRWYDEKTVVVKINEKFIQYDWYHVTGDTSISDMGLEFDLSSVKFCEPYEVTVTKYRPIES